MIDLISRSLAAIQFKIYRPEIQGPVSIVCRERRSHARSVHPIQDTSRMEQALVKQGKKQTQE